MATLDVSMGLRNLNGNETLYNKLLRRFIEGHAQAVQKIRAAMDAGDMETAVREAHTLKGVAASLGGPDLHAAALAAEQEIKEGTLHAGGLDALEIELGLFLAAINDRLA